MTVTDTVIEDESTCIATGRQCTAFELNHLPRSAVIGIVCFYAYLPAIRSGWLAASKYVTTEIQKAGRFGSLLEQAGGLVYSVLLADAAEVDLHARKERQFGTIPADLFPSH